MKNLFKAAVALAALSSALPVSAAVITLNFEGIGATYPFTNDTFINNYYNGGTASNGRSGTNYGVAFSANSLAVCWNSTTVTCSNGSRGGLAPGSATGGLFFLDGAASIMNVAAGFTTGFSFNYSAINNPGSVGVYSGLDGTGTLLATLALPTTTTGAACAAYNAAFCPFTAIGVAFNGTAKSVAFAGVANQIGFDDITFGATAPGGGVPEPATWAMMLAGFGLTGAALRRRRQQATVSFA